MFVLTLLEDLNINTLQNKLIDGCTSILVIRTVTNISNALHSNSLTTTMYIRNTYVALLVTIILAFALKDTFTYLVI